VTRDSQLITAVSAVQLAAGLGGMTLAIRRRRAFDIPFWHGQESAVSRDSLLMGTALSAPVVMLGAQAWATAALARRPNRAAERVPGGGHGAAGPAPGRYTSHGQLRQDPARPSPSLEA